MRVGGRDKAGLKGQGKLTLRSETNSNVSWTLTSCPPHWPSPPRGELETEDGGDSDVWVYRATPVCSFEPVRGPLRDVMRVVCLNFLVVFRFGQAVGLSSGRTTWARSPAVTK